MPPGFRTDVRLGVRASIRTGPRVRRLKVPATPAPEPMPGPVSALRESPRRAGRYAVEIGGVVIAPVSVETIGELGLAVGRPVAAPALARLLEASASTACYDKALDALARKGRSRRELERYLKQREHSPVAVAFACERLLSLGLLDDEAYARAYTEGPARARGFGSRRTVSELRRRGVESAVVDRVLGARDEEAREAERLTLRTAAERRAKSLRSLDPAVAQRRLVGWLVRRGFGIGEASNAAKQALRDA
ncbi:MAG: recombination regulator RecX [Gemmatimonadetes bacterium]|nr:recombination regulator RecX [Gemmatimonadota bacterium]